MAEDEIEKLLREIDQSTTPARPTPARQTPTRESSIERTDKTPNSGRISFAIVISVILGGVGFVAGLLFPFVGGFSAGVGAALGAFLTALITGPPRWFSR